MRGPAVGLLLLMEIVPAGAQNAAPPAVKLLSPAECANIQKLSENDYFITQPVTIGGMTISQSNVPKNGINYGGIDPFDVITRSCFTGKNT